MDGPFYEHYRHPPLTWRELIIGALCVLVIFSMGFCLGAWSAIP
jgi:hypothetical protein